MRAAARFPADRGPIRVLFVFAWLVVGGEETEVRLLAQHLDPARYRLDVLACFRKEGMPELTHEQLRELGVHVDTSPYGLSYDDTVAYLAGVIPAYDVVVACQGVREVYPALELLDPDRRPPLIEHGGLVSEALGGPKHLTTRYVGVCASIRDAAASRLPGGEAHALEIPSMVDLSCFDPSDREPARALLGVRDGTPLVGWVGRLDAKKRVEDFVDAAAIVHSRRPEARFVVVGGPDAFMPEYAEKLRARSSELGLDGVLSFLGDRPDVPRLLAALDVFAWLSRGEGMPHVVAEAGAARVPVVATRDNGTLQQIEDGVTGLFVGHEDPLEVADAIDRLIGDPALGVRLGLALRGKVAAEYSIEAVLPQWERLFSDVLEVPEPQSHDQPFRSFFIAGFECSTQRRRDGVRLDAIRATEHDVHAESDYRLASSHGLVTVRDALRWHLIEREPGSYDWSSWVPMLEAARRAGTQVIWDIWHYGTPDHIDIWSSSFVDRLADLAAAAARLHRQSSDEPALWCPLNEISFYAFIAGQVGDFHPYATERGYELKRQLVRAAIAAADALRAEDPRCRLLWAEPLIHVEPGSDKEDVVGSAEVASAEAFRLSQFQALDMVSGRLEPELGGRPGLLDIVGCNYYSHNQWFQAGATVPLGHRRYRPLSDMLAEVYHRYHRPIIVSETGAEGSGRAAWLHYVCQEVAQARADGIPVGGICLYPVTCYSGWDDNPHCETGLFCLAAADGSRPVYPPLLSELTRQRARFEGSAVATATVGEAQPTTGTKSPWSWRDTSPVPPPRAAQRPTVNT